MRPLIAGIRFAVAAAIAAAILTTLVATAARTAVNPFNFFGFFTVQSNVLLAAVLVCVAFPAAPPRRRALAYARGMITVYVVIVGLVYVTLLAPLNAAGGVPVHWANIVLHYVTPVYVAVDWIVVGDRPPLRWRHLWLILVYPAVWLGVVLVRGATDGWVPYPFLAPSNGYAAVAAYCAAIFAIAFAVGALAWSVSRFRGLTRDAAGALGGVASDPTA